MTAPAAPPPGGLPRWLAAYAKAHTALAGAVVTWLLAQYGPHLPANWLALAAAALTALGVFAVPNKTA